LNEFYGFPPSLDFNTGVFGRSPVTCPATTSGVTKVVHLMFSTNRPGHGRIHREYASSGASSDPLGVWNFYEIPAQNNGTQGTPDHGCDLGSCFGDFPHIGADANAIVLTTNEYSFFGNDYNGVELYALSKADLAAGSATPSMASTVQNLDVPALVRVGSRPGRLPASPHRTIRRMAAPEYLVSSTAGDGTETGNTTGGSDKMVVWALTNTSSLDSGGPDLGLQQAVVTTIPYVLPPKSFMRSHGPLPCSTASTWARPAPR
jgi:hypothetical protein